MPVRSPSLFLVSALTAGCFSVPDIMPLDGAASDGPGDTTGETGETSANPTTTTDPLPTDGAVPDPSTSSSGPGATTDWPGDGTSSSGGNASDDGTTTDGATDGTTTDDDGTTDDGTTEGAVTPCSDAPVVVSLPGPADTSCGGQWEVAGVPLQIQNSLHLTCGGGGCSAGSTAEGIWIYPAQLFAGLDGIDCEPSVVEVDLTSYGADVRVTLFDTAGAIVAESDSQLSGFPETVSIAVPLGAQIAGVGMHGCEDVIHQIRVL